jgi:hypothetical protein
MSLLDSGEAPVTLGDVQLWRSTSGPAADGRITVTVRVGEHISEAFARDTFRRVHGELAALAAAHTEFARLVSTYDCHWELVHDYGMGSVLVASEDQHGDVVWPTDGRH